MTGGQEDKDVLHTSPVMVLTGLGETKTIVKNVDLYRAGTAQHCAVKVSLIITRGSQLYRERLSTAQPGPGPRQPTHLFVFVCCGFLLTAHELLSEHSLIAIKKPTRRPALGSHAHIFDFNWIFTLNPQNMTSTANGFHTQPNLIVLQNIFALHFG